MSTCIPRAPCTNSSPILWRVSRPRVAAFLPEVLVPRLPHLCLCGVASKLFLSLDLSPSSTLASSAIPSDEAYVSVSLLEISLQPLIQVLFFSFTSTPSASTLWEMSFNFARGFELFHLSCDLCPASSTAERCQLDCEFRSFDDQPACLLDIARLSTAMFSDFRYRFSS